MLSNTKFGIVGKNHNLQLRKVNIIQTRMQTAMQQSMAKEECG